VVEQLTAAAPPRTIELTLDRAEGNIGIVTDLRASTLMLTGIGPGTLQKHNESSDASLQVRVNDFILQVNDKTDPEEMAEEMMSQTKLKLKVQRVVPFKAVVAKAGKPLGLRLAYHSTATTVGVTDIGAGAIQDYNTNALPDKQIQPNDRIMSVDGVMGHAEDMLKAMKGKDLIVLMVARVCP